MNLLAWFTTQECGAQRGHVAYPGAYSKLVQGPGLKLAPLAMNFSMHLEDTST